MGGAPKSSIFIGFSLLNHPAIRGTPMIMETPKCFQMCLQIHGYPLVNQQFTMQNQHF